MLDLIIVGGGPAGTSAAVYAARKQLKTLLITDEWGGQSVVSSDIKNWIGTPSISGADLAASLKKHVQEYIGEWLTVVQPARAASAELFDDHVEVATEKSEKYSAKALLVASGAARRKLEVPGAAEYDQKGLTYCASCDGPLYAGKDVAVIGGGNAAFETALQLLAYCKTVTLFNRGETFKADEITVAAATAHPNMRIIKNSSIVAIEGQQFVTGVRWQDARTNEESVLPVEGIFVEIGLLPNSGWIEGKVEMNQVKQIKTDPHTQRTSHPRAWAAGDITDALYHQNNIAAGDAVKALEDIYMTLHIAKHGK